MFFALCVCRRACDMPSFINTEPKAATGKDDEMNEKKRGTLLMMAHFFFLFIMFHNMICSLGLLL